MNKKAVILISAGAIAFYFYKQITSLKKKIAFKVNSLKFDNKLSLNSGYGKLNFKLTGIVNNKSSLNILVKDFFVKIYFQGKPIATAQNNTPFVIQGEKKNELIANVEVITKNIFPSVVTALNQLSNNPKIKISGYLITSVGKLNFSDQINLLS